MAVILTDDDYRVLKELLTQFRLGRVPGVSTRIGNLDTEMDYQAPEVYIALPPIDGIPALDKGNEIAGTGSGERDVPGSAVCDIYQTIIHPTTKLPELWPVPDFTKLVYNLSGEDIAQDWVVIKRTKFGRWVVEPSGSQCDFVAFIIDEADCETGTATVTITHRTCPCTSVPDEYGIDKLDVYDATCFFVQATNANLIGRAGFAKRMRSDTDTHETGTGTGTAGETCRWIITFLCPINDVC